jgi:fucose permease
VKPPAPAILLFLSYVGFVSLGLPDTVLGAACPAMRAEFGLPLDAAGAAVLVTTGGVVLSSTASGWLRTHVSAGLVLSGSTILAAFALIASGLAPRWSLLLMAAGCAGLGGGAIDATLNDHVARHHSARHMNWLHACWGVGASIAPNVVAFELGRGQSWRAAYLGLGVVEAVLALSFVATRALWGNEVPAADGGGSAAATSPPCPRAALASVAMFYCYGGLEAGTGLWAASLLAETRHASLAAAGAAVGFYWGSLCAGRFVVGVWADRVGPSRILTASVWAALVAVAVLAWPGTPAWFVVSALGALGFALAPIYPLAMHDTPRRFSGPAGGRLVGRQVAATAVGVASLPWLIGAIAQRMTLAWLPALLVILAVAVIALERARRDADPGHR